MNDLLKTRLQQFLQEDRYADCQCANCFAIWLNEDVEDKALVRNIVSNYINDNKEIFGV